MKRITQLIFLLSFIWITANAQKEAGYDPGFRASQSGSVIQDKCFYLFTAIRNDQQVMQIMENDPVFQSIYRKQQNRIDSSLINCKNDLNGLVNAYRFSAEDIRIISDELKSMVLNQEPIRRLVTKNIRPSGDYENYKSRTDDQLLVDAWQLCAKGMNHILDVYGLGQKALYPSIDSVSYDVKSPYYIGNIYMWSDMLRHKRPGQNKLFFQSSLDFSLSLLYLNHRNEAGRYEPLEDKENKKAVEHLRNIDFRNYDYASIVILGNGPENYRDSLSALGKLNIQLGVLEYEAGRAPLIIVSGGHAHPFRTKFCEAIEMKRELMNFYHIPEEYILVDPLARHTTTNLRNASRLMIRYHIPVDKNSLVVTNNGHSMYVGSKEFTERCMNELGYLPVRISKRLSSTTLEFRAHIESLQQNPADPLDP